MPTPFFLGTWAWVNTLLGPTHSGGKPDKNGIWPSAWALALDPDVSFSSNTHTNSATLGQGTLKLQFLQQLWLPPLLPCSISTQRCLNT